MTDQRPLGDPEQLLSRPGRASNPPVDTQTFPLRLADLLGVDRDTHGTRTIAVADAEVLDILRASGDVIEAVPGACADLVRPAAAQRAVVDERRLTHGAWLGASDGSSVAMVAELVDLLRSARQAGGTAVLVTDRYPTESTAILAAAADVVLPLSPDHPELVEGAPLPEVLTRLDALTRSRHER